MTSTAARQDRASFGIDARRVLMTLRTRARVLGGVGLLVFAGLATAWLIEIDAFAPQRSSATEALGIGVFPPLALLILAGLWLLTGAARLPRRVWRGLGVTLVGYVVFLGIAGFVDPSWTLGPSDLSRVSAGGDLGAWLSSPLGVFVLLTLLLSISAIVAPQRTRQALWLGGTGLGQASRWLGTNAHQLWIRRPRREPTDLWESGVGPSVGVEADDGWDATDAAEVGLPAAEPHLAPEVGVDGSPPAVLATPAPPEPAVAGAAGARVKPRGRRESADGWILPPLSLLKSDAAPPKRGDSARQAQIIVETLASFGVAATVSQINEGPAVTQFGVEPGWDVKTRLAPVRDAEGQPVLDASGQPTTREEEVSRTRVRVNKITRLTNDIALALAAPSIRVEAPVPGEPVIGIEVPNQETRMVSLRGVLESPAFAKVLKRGGLPIALGRNVTGRPVAVDLTQMPHLLIAGATGSGKSVAINSIIASLLLHHSPERLRLVLVDPKRVELTEYEHVPHLAFSRVVTDAEEVVGLLAVVVAEMERRYYRFQQVGARNLAAYNGVERPEGPLPYWVVILDELADLMMAAPVEVEAQLVRLAQLARATGIHLVIATQRPSVDVVTGLIKANFPTRIAFATTSQTDSRVILDRVGAEKLLGRGDMLLHSQDRLSAQRIQGTFVSDEEITALIGFWTQDRFQNLPRPTLDHLLADAMQGLAEPAQGEFAAPPGADPGADLAGALARSRGAGVPEAPVPAADVVPAGGDRVFRSANRAAPLGESADTLYPRALALAHDHSRISASMLQRRLRIGHPRAARLLNELTERGVVGPAEGGQSREVLGPPEEVLGAS